MRVKRAIEDFDNGDYPELELDYWPTNTPPTEDSHYLP